MNRSCHWDIFCRVVDNFGDIGVCWRLARQLVNEQHQNVRLWVDDLASFKRICPQVDASAAHQHVCGVEICHWTPDFPRTAAADVVVEAFGCSLPEHYLRAMTERQVPPAWINLEYLSAEAWVESCHLGLSPHPFLALNKHFFFPGFTPRTGGLLEESALAGARQGFLNDTLARERFWHRFGLESPGPNETRVSLFGYANLGLNQILEACARDEGRIWTWLVPIGVMTAELDAFFGGAPIAGQTLTRGNLRVHGIPFLDQDSYDRLLWSCDLNFVRGEDSFVRAQWAERPMVWQIYPQPDNAHLAKLDAFLERYTGGWTEARRAGLMQLSHAWNGQGGDAGAAFGNLSRQLDAWSRDAASWAQQLRSNGNVAARLAQLAGNLLK